jgi:hypothetical protein
LWVEVGSQFARQWRAFFMRLERIHLLNAKDPTQLWLLHLLFLDEINADAEEFRQEWNLHPIRGVQTTKNQSPSVSRLYCERMMKLSTHRICDSKAE